MSDGKRKACNNREIHEHIRVGLCGLGGVGKTQDALDFVYSTNTTCNVLWIHSGSVVQFEEDCRKLAHLVRIPEINGKYSSQNVKGIVKSWLESETRDNLVFVLDDADNKDDFFSDSTRNPSPELAKYIPSCGKGIVIITTRDRTVALQLAGPRNVLTKEAMDPTDTDALFKYHYRSGSPYQDTSYP
ncbi:hypothetical protein FPQ18DRAFT_410642 [Pyronema domesticum]|nr:hypothetical protein FPQ18DRAFT_410642 [Pyronema domesticum]